MANGKWYAWEFEMKLIERPIWVEKPCYYLLLGNKNSFEWKEVKYTWPVCTPLTGKLEQNQPYPLARNTKYNNVYFQDDFNNDELGMHWTSGEFPKKNAIDLNLQPDFYA